MAKLEKVIKGLRCLSNPYIQDMDERDCENCKYDNASCFLDVTADALSLLKAQEPILLENQHKPYGHFINANSPWISRCPKCGKKIEGKQTRFCKYCGQAVKWE